MSVPPMTWQPSLLDTAAPPGVDESFTSLVRVHLDERSWVDHAPGWFAGADRLFDELVAGVAWAQGSRWMYERVVDEPRLTAAWATGSGEPLGPAALARMREVLGGRYHEAFDSVGLNLYRDGRDSVAWHGDRVARDLDEPLVALVSLGAPRPFLLRPTPVPGAGRPTGAAGRTRRFLLGHGDLLVTGGRCQRDWQHSVPKVRAAGPRISVAFRRYSDG